ncbi:toll-like receptor 3 [Coccinella septempunctata]|uniref:toll-like receptor 3 n=1 Tax=Coccinella septempunctata TaxID=41139 RepID=UPI001D0722A6|nr:toll-like receptor 3 [Coccinella septempunctata]XP_044758952.1 toll-like receptor 3 [Coccinella septempunctata]
MMSFHLRILSVLVLFFVLPIILAQILQEDSCCSKKVRTNNSAFRAKSIATNNGCICKQVFGGSTSICYNLNNEQNSCRTYPKQIAINTTELILRSTSIKEILGGDFSNLNHVKILRIEQNSKLLRIHELVFMGMQNLTVLNIVGSPLLNSFHPDVFNGLTKLEELKVVNCGFFKMEDLTQALSIRTLPSLRILNITGNNFVNISNHAFDYMRGEGDLESQLEELDISSCGIKNIEKQTLNPLKKLTSLHLGNNSLRIDTLVDILEGAMSSGVKITSLDLHSFGINTSIPESLSKLLAASNIDTLTLSGNQFGLLGEKTIPHTLPMLKSLYMSNVMSNFIEDSFFSRIPNVENLTLNKHNLSYFTIPKALSNLRYLDLSEFTKNSPWEFFHLETQLDETKIEYLDLHSTRLAFLLKDSFRFMPDLKALNLKKSLIAKISTGAFAHLEKLKYLNLEDNKFFIMYIRYPSEPFLGLENLESLLVGGNAISYISANGKNLFKHLTNLKCLGLQRNSLEVITAVDFEPLQNLQVLDISANPLYAWDDRVFFRNRLEKFYASSNHFSYLSRAMLDDFRNITTLDIDYSPFSCDCRMTRRMLHNKIVLREMNSSSRYRNLLCAGSHDLTVLDFLESANYEECEPKRSYMMYFLWTFFVFAFIAAVLILIYMVRDQIPYANSFVRSTESRQSIL